MNSKTISTGGTYDFRAGGDLTVGTEVDGGVTDVEYRVDLAKWTRVFSVSQNYVAMHYAAGMSTSTPGFSSFGVSMENRNTWYKRSNLHPNT